VKFKAFKKKTHKWPR